MEVSHSSEQKHPVLRSFTILKLIIVFSRQKCSIVGTALLFAWLVIMFMCLEERRLKKKSFQHVKSKIGSQFRFSVEGNAWTKLPDMKKARHSFCAVEIEGKIYLIGGADEL